MSEVKDKLVIEVRGGVVTAVNSTIPKSNLDLLVVDYDRIDECMDNEEAVATRKAYFDFRQKDKLETSKLGFPMKKLGKML